ncbi:50S ribosomal protein L28 [Candidatus Kaiserbacteria bacterium]|nr:50S ribosomal protein L28 [Candidatus Kaiserbacteria bacterium]
MAKACQITGKSTQIGGRYSNRTRATQFNSCGKVRRKPNLQTMSVHVPEIGKTIKLKSVSAAGKRTIAKKGPYQALKDAKII